MTSDIPQEVLSRALGDAVAGRRVRVAVFTTFCFEPGFFELQVLPVLFEHPFRQADVLKRIQLEDALREVDELAVYYDQRELVPSEEPATLDYRRIDVRHATGAFHPKLILLLVDELPDRLEAVGLARGARRQSLLVGILSANLTRAGWWENVECAHFEEIRDRELSAERVPFRRDLLGLLRRVRRAAAPAEEHRALERIGEFLGSRTVRDRPAHERSGGKWHTRIFHGQTAFAEWLRARRLGAVRFDWNLEIISPYFPRAGARPLLALRDRLGLRQVRVSLPLREDGSAAITAETYAAVEAAGARWARLPAEVTGRGSGGQGERLSDRFVHAKVYRFWGRAPDGGRREILVVGSVNCTEAAHGRGRNVEAAWLVDGSAGGRARWWLQPLEAAPQRFAEEAPAEESEASGVSLDLALSFDWATGHATYRLREDRDTGLRVLSVARGELFVFTAEPGEAWRELGEQASAALEEQLRSTSFVEIEPVDGTPAWVALVREENVAHRPSLLARLTPEQILEFWSLLSPEQRAAFLEKRLPELRIEGLELAPSGRFAQVATLFDRFAGIYHAFGCLGRSVHEALDEGREHAAESRLFGSKYDSLPTLLEREVADDARDPLIRYVTFLCARQVVERVAQDWPEFAARSRERTVRLQELLSRSGEVRAAVGLDDAAFLEWFEPAFLAAASDPDEFERAEGGR